MSLTLLLEKYDVSTEEGLEKALNEIEKEESEVNEALTNVLSRACTLEGRLRTASQAYTKLGEVKKDAELAAGMVDKTAMLARDVSAKVRQLDLARSRVAECQRRVHDLIDLKICSAGVETAIKAHDYETAAGHVARFLSMEPGSVAAARARGAPDPRRDMDAAAKTLRDHLVKKFEEAARNEDDAAVERLFKLFPQIGRAEEGVELFAKYIASQLEVTLRRSSTIQQGAGAGAGAAYADAATRVLEAAAARLERLRLALAGAAPAPALLCAAVRRVQPTICNAIRRVCSEMVTARRVGALAGAVAGAGADALAAEPVLSELALMHSRLQMYFAFLRRKIQSNKDADDATKASSVEDVEKIIASCDMTRTAQDVLSHYLTLERYFLEESVNKALKLSSASSSSNTSSLVDDVFFIARKVIRRAISTSSVDGVCAVLNEATGALEGVAAALRRRLASAPPDALPLPPPERAAPDGAAAVLKLPSRDLDSQRALFLAQMNECSLGAEWAELLAEQAYADAALLCRGAGASGASGASGDAKLKSCAGGLGAAAAAFRAALDAALGALRAALLPPVCEWADALVDGGDVDEDSSDLSSLDVEEEAGALPARLEALGEAARARAPAAADAVLNAAVADLLARAERNMLRNSYTRAGGLRVERRCRRLASWVGGGAPAQRERAAALSAAATLLAVERVKDASEALPATPMSPARVREVLARRIDFKPEEIKRLKL